MANQPPPCLWFHEVDRTNNAFAGGKAANLGDMASAGLPVPPGFVITTTGYWQMIKMGQLDVQIKALLNGVDRHDAEAMQKASGKIHDLFDHALLDSALSHTVLQYYDDLGTDAVVAVRSSSTAEDTATASFAGQQKTFLNVSGHQQLLRAIKDCWASLYSPHAMFYRSEQGFDTTKVAMAVVIQRMVDVDKAGVLFTVDPIMKNHFNMMIEAVWGLGEGLVSGQITPDSYKVDRDNFDVVHQYVPRKAMMIAQSEYGGIAELTVPKDLQEAQVLTPAELQELVELGIKVEEHFGSPQDIEWGIEADTLYLLQSRPITNL